MRSKSICVHKQTGRRGIKNIVEYFKEPDYSIGRRSSRVHKPTEKFKGFLSNIGLVSTESSKNNIIVQSNAPLDNINDFTSKNSFNKVSSEKKLQDSEEHLKMYRNLAEKRKRTENESLGVFEESCRKKMKNFVGNMSAEEMSQLKYRDLVVNKNTTALDKLTTMPSDCEKEGRPPYSYSKLIVQAITSVPQQQMTLDDICIYIEQNHPYYQNSTEAEWQTHIRNNLLTPYFMRVENSYVNGRGYLWKMDPNFSERLMDQAFRARNDTDIVNQNICSYQSNFTSEYLPKEKIRKMNKSEEMILPKSYIVSQNSNGNELQLKLKPLKASDITETFLKDHDIRTQSQDKLKTLLSRNSTSNGCTIEVAPKLEKSDIKALNSASSSEKSPRKDKNLERNNCKFEIVNVNSPEKPSLMPIPHFRIPAKCMSETRIRALSISPPHTPIKENTCKASACFEKKAENSNNEHNVESNSSSSFSEYFNDIGNDEKISKWKNDREKRKSNKIPYEPDKFSKINELATIYNSSESFKDKGDEFKLSKVVNHRDGKKNSKYSSKQNTKTPNMNKLTNEDEIYSGENSFIDKTDKKNLKTFYSNSTNANLYLEKKYASHKNFDDNLGVHEKKQQKIKFPRKHESNAEIKFINKTPEYIVQESTAACERRSERVPKPTEKLIDFIVSKGKSHYNGNCLIEEENLVAEESSNKVKEKEQKNVPTNSEDEFKSPKLPKIISKGSRKLDILQVSNNEKKSRRKQPPNTIRKITTDGSLPGNADGYKPKQEKGRKHKPPKKFNEFITGYPLSETKTGNQVSPSATKNVDKEEKITIICAKQDDSKSTQSNPIKAKSQLKISNEFLEKNKLKISFTENSAMVHSKPLTRSKTLKSTYVKDQKSITEENSIKVKKKVDKISNIQISSDNVIKNSKEVDKKEVNVAQTVVYKCTECKMSFINRRVLKRHIITHKILITCKLKGLDLNQI